MHVIASADHITAETLQTVVAERTLNIVVTSEAGEVIRIWSEPVAPEVIIIDQVLNGIDGEQLAALLGRGSTTRVVLISATLAEGGASSAPADVIIGRSGGEELRELVREALRVPITSEEPVILKPSGSQPRSVTQHLVRHWQRVTRIVDQLREGVAIAEPDGTVLFANPAMFDLLNASAPKLIGHGITGFLSAYDREEIGTTILKGEGNLYTGTADSRFLNMNVQTMEEEDDLRIIFCEPADDAIHAQIASDLVQEVSDLLIELSGRLSKAGNPSPEEAGDVLCDLVRENFPDLVCSVSTNGEAESGSARTWSLAKSVHFSLSGNDLGEYDTTITKLVNLIHRHLS